MQAPFKNPTPQNPTLSANLLFGQDHLHNFAIRFLLEQIGERVTATSRGYKYVGTLHGTALHLMATDDQGDIITMGLDGSLDDAFKEATSDMASWLQEDYNLTPSEIAQVLGTAEYQVSEVADRNAGMVLKISKARLATLAK